MLANLREQLQTLNNVQFTEGEWRRFVETFLDKPSDGLTDKTRKIHEDYIHNFVFDDGRIQNIYLLDKKNQGLRIRICKPMIKDANRLGNVTQNCQSF